MTHRLTPDTPTVPTTVRTYEDVFMLSELADQLIAEADICGDIRSGPWLFLARLGEGIPVASADIEQGARPGCQVGAGSHATVSAASSNADTVTCNPGVSGTCGKLWTMVADIEPEARLPVCPSQIKFGVVAPRPNSSCLHEKNVDAVERVAAFDGAGIAICVDRNNPRNDDLIWSLTCLLEPRHPDDTGPMIWYGCPSKPLVAGECA